MLTTYPVVVSNPSGSLVRFTPTDGGNTLDTVKLLRSVTLSAVEAFVAAERADLITNGDDDFVYNVEKYAGDKNRTLPEIEWDLSNGYATVALTATTNLNVSQTITTNAPFADVV